MKSLLQYINESVNIKTAADFKKDLDLKFPSGLKYKNGLGKIKVNYKKYNDFVKGFKYEIKRKYPSLEFLGELKDESGVYSLDGGESISGNQAIYNDYVITTDNDNKYLYRELTVGNDVYLTFRLIDDSKNEPMIKTMEVKNKLDKMLPYDMSAEEVFKKYFKIKEIGESKTKFPGPDKDIVVEIKEMGNSMFAIYINGEKKFSNNIKGLSIKLSGDMLKNYLMEVVVDWYKNQIK